MADPVGHGQHEHAPVAGRHGSGRAGGARLDTANPPRASQFTAYVIGRPLMLIFWVVALWGTAAGVRLVWIGATQGASAALRLLALPSVSFPVLLAVFMWTAVAVALSRFGRDGEP